MSRDTDRRKPKLVPEVDEAFLLARGVVAVSGEEMAGDTLVAEVETTLAVDTAPTDAGVKTADLEAAAAVAAGVELVMPY